jgi:hypothetical protein
MFELVHLVTSVDDFVLNPVPMSRVSPRSLKFQSSISQARLDGVPCQRSMYIMFFEGHTCKDWAQEVSLTSN